MCVCVCACVRACVRARVCGGGGVSARALLSSSAFTLIFNI